MRGSWTPIRVEVGGDFLYLHPTDATWVIDVRDGYGTPLADRDGLRARLECGRREYPLRVVECREGQRRRLFVPAQALPPLGDRDHRCTLEVELRDGEGHRWWDANWGIALRSGLRTWLRSEAARQ